MLAHLPQFCKRVPLFALPIGRREQDTPAPSQISHAQATRKRMAWYRPHPWRFGLCWCTLCVVLPRSAVCLPGLLVVFPSLLCIAPHIPDPRSLTPYIVWCLTTPMVAHISVGTKGASYAPL